jgi:vancomycin resistance protein YoaR
VSEQGQATGIGGMAWRIGLIVGGVLAGVLALYLGVVVAVGDGVRAGTTVKNVKIGGLSVAEATEKLDATLGVRAARNLRVRALDQVFIVDPREAGLTFDAEATVMQAAGREWNPLRLVRDLTSQRSVEPVLVIDQAALNQQVASMAATVAQPAVEPQLTMAGLTPQLRSGKPGRSIDEPATADLMAEAFIKPRQPIDAPVVRVPATVTPPNAAAAEAFARQAVSAPVTVDADGQQVSIPPDAIARALTFTQEGAQLQPQLDGATLHAAIRGPLRAVETPGRDATFRIKNGKPVVVKSRVGRGIEDQELATRVLTVLDRPAGQRTTSVTMGVREPALTTADARNLGVKEKISSFTQTFPYAAYRTQNIGQAAKYVNGTLLLPGQTFSMNDTIKERTVANGYTVGYIVGSGGIFDEALGGGVSAATTAVWTAAFFAGMDRTYTQAHSIYISRYKPGLEATVAWGVFDMKFTNNTPYGVFITTSMTNTSMTVNFWSTRMYDEIRADFGPRTNIRAHQTVYNDSPQCSSQSGMDGFSINVDRVFIKDGAEVKRETIATNYRPSPKVVCGEKPKKKKKRQEEAGVTEDPGTTPSPRPTRTPRPEPADPDPGNEFGPDA